MSMTAAPVSVAPPRGGRSAQALANAIRRASFAKHAVTVVGYGHVGREYVKALQALGVGRIRVCSRSAAPLAELDHVPGLTCVPGGFERLSATVDEDELGVIATPTTLTGAAAERLAAVGFRRLLIEKPVALESAKIEALAARLAPHGVQAVCGYNRLAYPALCEAIGRAEQDGGITSCVYSVSEMVKPDWPQRFPSGELARWGVANSLHVISMAHGAIGRPTAWSSERSGRLDWHPSGAVFVGAGISERGIPFAYHGDWRSQNRWWIDLHTAVSSYRLCPLERLFRRASALGPWEELPLGIAVPEVKAGITEELAAMLCDEVRALVRLCPLDEAAALTRFAEAIFGYSSP